MLHLTCIGGEAWPVCARCTKEWLRFDERSLADLTEACPLCKVAYTSRTARASHAATAHGYRCQATELAHGRTCYSCGKVYANQARLRRHLIAVFMPAGEAPVLYPQCPPVFCPGDFCETYPSRTEPACDALARGLRELATECCSSDNEILDFVTSFIAPLPLLRQTANSGRVEELLPSCIAERVQL